ncbi:hypothetical protein JP0131_09520 [Helicobacter pylori]|nr:hypothetical protein JP0131_09520 [Helicobacter pylori]
MSQGDGGEGNNMDTTKENLNGSKERLSGSEYQWAVALVYTICISINARIFYDIDGSS